VTLPIQKSALKNHVAAGSKIGSDGGVISRFTFFFCWEFTFSLYNINFVHEIKEIHIDSASRS
jgi:hypothetical protein